MKLSVIIPSYNRRESLGRCLATLFQQDLAPALYEVVVVVDGSTDGTSEMLSTLQARAKLVVIQQDNCGQSAALNAGVNAASGELVLFLDDDVLCDPGLLSAHVGAHRQDYPILVFGRMRGISGPLPSSVELQMSESLKRYYARLEKDSRPKWPEDAWVGPNCSLPRLVFLEAGGYHEKLFPRRGEDVDLGLRLWKRGVQFRYEPRALTSHHWVKSRRQEKRDDELDGVSHVRLCRRYPEYRAHSGLVGAMTAPAWKRLAARAAASNPLLATSTIGAIESLGRVSQSNWAQATAMRAFLIRQSIGVLAGAKREAGSWQALTGLFGRRLSVLLYHHIGPANRESQHLALTVAPAKFRRQIRWLRWRGYTAITVAQWEAWCKTGVPLPKKPVLLSFDDAYGDLTNYAFPSLEQWGWPCTLFVISGKSGGATVWDGLPVMTTAQIQYWASRGVEIGAHTRTHPDLTVSPDEVVTDEVNGSKRDLTEAGIAPLSFAYPYGCFDARVRASVGRYFSLAFTCEEGRNDLSTDPLLLKRTMVQPGDTLLDVEFRAALGSSPLNRIRSRLRLRSRFLGALRLFKISAD